MKERFYNVFYLPDNRWTNLNEIGFGCIDTPGFSDRNPKRMSLDEARKFLARIVNTRSSSNLFTILEMDANNKPIIPKCRIK
jgi:hypothetical protein